MNRSFGNPDNISDEEIQTYKDESDGQYKVEEGIKEEMKAAVNNMAHNIATTNK